MSFKKNRKSESIEAEQETISEQDLELEAMLAAEETALAELAAEPVSIAEPVIAVQVESKPAIEITPEPVPAMATVPAPAVAKNLSVREQARLARAEKYETMLRKRHPHLSDEKIHKLLKSYV